MMFKVTFKIGSGKDNTVFAASGESLLEAARKAGIAIDAPCSGKGTCGKCRVKVLSGEVKSKKSIHVSEVEYNMGIRLACRTFAEGDAAVEIPETVSSYQSGMKIADLSSPEETAIFHVLIGEMM